MVSLPARLRRVFTITFGSTSAQIAIRQVTNANRISLIRQQLGLNDSTVILEGRMVNPKKVTSDMEPGKKASFTWAGATGMVRIEPYQSVQIERWREKYGDRVVLSWRSDDV